MEHKHLFPGDLDMEKKSQFGGQLAAVSDSSTPTLAILCANLDSPCELSVCSFPALRSLGMDPVLGFHMPSIPLSHTHLPSHRKTTSKSTWWSQQPVLQVFAKILTESAVEPLEISPSS